jgi:exopolysaccharide production protein ExoQ
VIGHELWFFHNNFIEVAVGFGVIGAVLFVAGLLAGTVKVIKDFIYNKEYTTLWSALYMFFVIFISLGENPLFSNHSQPQFLMVAAVAARGNRERSQRRIIKLRYGHLGTGISAPQRG